MCEQQYRVLESFNAQDVIPRSKFDIQSHLLDQLLNGPLVEENGNLKYCSPRDKAFHRLFTAESLLFITRPETISIRSSVDLAWVDAALVYCLKHAFKKSFEELEEVLNGVRRESMAVCSGKVLQERLDSLIARGLVRQEGEWFQYEK